MLAAVYVGGVQREVGARGGCMGKLGPQEGGAMGKLGRLVVVQCMQFDDHFFPDVPMACAM